MNIFEMNYYLFITIYLHSELINLIYSSAELLVVFYWKIIIKYSKFYFDFRNIFLFICFDQFAVSEEKIFLTLANQKQELPLAAIFVGGMGRNEETL
jgi:hypothetical protein